jgi:SAM-dependent methyltransferase
MKRNPSEGWSDYPDHFSSPDDVVKYDELFESDACERVCWTVQRPILVTVLSDLRLRAPEIGNQALDFACGSGRITGAVQDAGWSVAGLDASGAMLEVARLRLPELEFCEGRLGESKADEWVAARGGFQLVTSFRFFLNAPADQREAILNLLVAQLTPRGHLVLNNHGSGPSLRNLGLRVRHKSGSTTITQRAFAEMLSTAGLHVEHQWGSQLFPRSLYGAPIVGGIVRAIERFLPKTAIGRAIARRFGANQTYVCRAS